MSVMDASQQDEGIRELLGNPESARAYIEARLPGKADMLIRYARANGRSTWAGWVVIYRRNTRGPARWEIRKDTT